MKKTILFSIGILVMLTACTEVSQKVDVSVSDKNIYNRALRFGDATTAVNSLYRLIESDEANSTYLDSLALIYFQVGMFPQSELVCEEIIAKDAGKDGILEMLAVSQTAQGKILPAIESYEKLVPVSKNVFHTYKLAELQYRIKRLAEAYANVQAAEQLPSNEQDKINFTIDQNQVQSVGLRAAIYNLKGVIEQALITDNPDAAIASFEKALELEPEFIVAKNNLQSMTKE